MIQQKAIVDEWNGVASFWMKLLEQAMKSACGN